MKVQEALNNTLVMLDALTVEFGISGLEPLIAECKSALEDIEKCEPVAWMHKEIKSGLFEKPMSSPEQFIPLYTSPISKEWVGLTDAEALKLWDDLHPDSEQRSKKDYWLAIEAKLKQLNAEKG